MPIHRVPVAKRIRVKEALDRYTAAGIIKKIEGPTSWCSNETVRMAREKLFWPGIRQAIFDMCNNCSTCAQYGSKSTKEPMRSLPIPTLPWHIISQDIFIHGEKAYLVTVCHFFDWIEVDELDDTYLPHRQRTSKDYMYMDFASQYRFTHTTSSPYHCQGNDRAEAAVKVSESMLKNNTNTNNTLNP